MQLITPPYDGPANHVRHVFHQLVRQGHQVQLLARLNGGIYRSDDLATFTPVVVNRADRGSFRQVERGVRSVQGALGLPYVGLFESVRFALACRQELTECDLFYERNPWMHYGGVLAGRWLQKPVVLEDNGDALADLEAKGTAPTGLHRRVALATMRRAMHAASHVIASGDGWRQAGIERWGLSPDRITTVENGTTLIDLLARDALRSFGPQQAAELPVVLVYLGGFYPWHGVPILLRAFAKARAHTNNMRLLLIGSGQGLAGAQDLAVELSLGADVVFAGHLSDQEYAPLLAQSDIGLAPYCHWPEYSGLKLLDYKAAGLASIVSGRDGQPATIAHGCTGWIVPPCDEDALAEALIRLVTNPALRRDMGQAARLEAETQHSWGHTVERIEQILAQTLHASRPVASPLPAEL